MDLRNLIVLVLACCWLSSTALAVACTGLEAHTCALPFPSNEFTVPDAGSATGLQVSISDDVLPPHKLDLLPARVRPAAILNGRDGFSPLGAAMFELGLDAPMAALESDPGQWVHAFSVDTGAPIEVVAGRSPAESIIGEHRRGQQAIAEFDYPVEFTGTRYYRRGTVAAKIRGRALLPDFRGEDGLVEAVVLRHSTIVWTAPICRWRAPALPAS
ncbi:hypothetical protein [Ketobacter alkanivorans]|uniref:Uncharacterized protein n=1 Tax=Ketobacter alkanivorans TaxID=1917421 RepID=A0A2K9LLU2_9GAMM|nr:hypothetical protein [Ketobacter alkanivorans]AUM13220.1 hypothetical protein Kalk_12645 [Ketobacter alkanivorans]